MSDDWKDCDRCGTPDGEVDRLRAEVERLAIDNETLRARLHNFAARCDDVANGLREVLGDE